MAKTVYDLIKRQNGEHFAQAIRNFDSGIFDIPDIVSIVKYAGRDAAPILSALESLKTADLTQSAATATLSPFELLHRAGYHAVYADTLDKQNAIKKYFAPGEELCTFRDRARYKDYYIVNAVRYDVDQIRRADFPIPAREDVYGTSVMSIQMAKTGGFISIKNRYNHTVSSPDNTYNSNPDRIIYGLAASLMQYFDIRFNKTDNLPDNFIRVGHQIVRWNIEVNGIYFGADFYVKNGAIVPIHKDRAVLMDNFVLDLTTNVVTNIAGTVDAFPDIINREIRDKKLTLTKPDANGTVHISADGAPVLSVCHGEICGLNLPTTQMIEGKFLEHNEALKTLDLPHAETIGSSFLYANDALESINLPRVKEIGHEFLYSNNVLKSINLPRVTTIGNEFLYDNNVLQSINMPRVTTIGANFLFNNNILESIDLPRVKEIDTNFLTHNTKIKSIDLPRVKEIGSLFLLFNTKLESINIPNIEIIGDSFLLCNTALKGLNMPRVTTIGNDFLENNRKMESIAMPRVTTIGNMFLPNNTTLQEIVMPFDVRIGVDFLKKNTTYRRVTPCPKAEQFQHGCQTIAARAITPQRANDSHDR